MQLLAPNHPPPGAAPNHVVFTHFARMIDHGKGKLKTVSFSYLKGTRKSFAVTDGFVPVDPQDVETLKVICENHEPPWRGGFGKPLFEVMLREEALATLQREHTETILKGQGSAGAHAMLALMGPLSAPVPNLPMAPPQPMYAPLPVAQPQAPVATAPAPVQYAAPPPAPAGQVEQSVATQPKLGQRRRGGKGAQVRG